MSTITFVLRDGSSLAVESSPDVSVMRSAVRNSIPGIDAECGGALSCATCHVYLDESASSLFGSPSEMELDLLDSVANRTPASRLSCQLIPPDSAGEITIRIPAGES